MTRVLILETGVTANFKSVAVCILRLCFLIEGGAPSKTSSYRLVLYQRLVSSLRKCLDFITEMP